MRFDGESVVRANISTEAQRQLVEDLQLDVWSHESWPIVSDNVDIRVSLHDMQKLKDAGISFNVWIPDVQRLIDVQESQRLKSSPNADYFTEYHDYEETLAQARQWAQEYSSIATFIPSIGNSIQGRSLFAIRLHANALLEERSDIPKIFFNGGQHAREWISPATVMYIMHELLVRYGQDPQVTELLTKAEVVIIPIVNPDGYDYAWTNNRLWRKNRRANTGGSFGVDLNRNWDDHWGGQGSSRIPTSDVYCGTAPFSEPETTAVSKFFNSLGSIRGAIDFHSYSQLILRPYGWTTAKPPNEQILFTLGAGMQKAILGKHGKHYTNEAAWELYFTTGSAEDWYYSKGLASLCYTIELRDTGRFGFLLPPAEIRPTGEESYLAAIYFATFAIKSS